MSQISVPSCVAIVPSTSDLSLEASDVSNPANDQKATDNRRPCAPNDKRPTNRS